MDELDKYCGCNKPVIVGCENQVDLECVYYTGDKLDPLNINSGANGNSILKIINDYIKNVLENLEVPETHIANIGNKIGIYKSLSASFIHEFKTLSGIEGIVIENKGDYIEFSVDTEWLLDNIIILFENQTFKDFFINYNKDIFNTDIWKVFFEQYIKTMFSTLGFQYFFANYIKNIFTTGLIDICELIQGCIPQTNNPPVMNGDVTYNVANRVVNFPLNTNDFTSKYFDAEGDAFVSIKITGGDLTGLIKADLTPLAVNDIIPVNQISQIKFNGKNQDPGYTQTVTYVAINSAGQQSN